MDFEREAAVKFNENVKKVLMVDFVGDYLTFFSNYYDENLIQAFKFNDFDRTAPIYLKPDIMNHLRVELTAMVGRIDPKGTMLLRGLDSNAFSKPSRKDTDPLRLFYFYIHGTADAYVALTQEHYLKMMPFLKGEFLGRFGNMHLMEMSRYEQIYTTIPDNFRVNWPNPLSIKHPFSFAPPIRIFEDTWRYMETRFTDYFKKAAKMTFGS